MYKKISELSDKSFTITQNFADDLNRFVEFAQENFDEGLNLSDIVNHHLHEVDRTMKFDKAEAEKVDVDITLTASAKDNIEFLAQENDVNADFIFEKIVETIVSDRKFRKWEKTQEADTKEKVEVQAPDEAHTEEEQGAVH